MNVVINGQLINYVDEGKGRVLLFLHGWGADLTSFDGLANHFKQHYRVIRVDFPGFGKSPKPDDSWGVGTYSELVADFIAKLKLGNVHAVIGHSFGGRVIIKAVAGGVFAPERVVLLDSAGVKPPTSFKKSLYKSAAKLGGAVTSVPGLRSLRPMLRKNLYAAAGSTDYLNAQSMKHIFLNTINEDLLPLVGHVTQPTLLVWGEHDTETPVSDAYQMMNELPHAQLVVVPEAGHFVFLDDPNAVIKELEAFL